MKNLVQIAALVLSTVWSVNSVAATCGNISGSYVSNQGIHIKYTLIGCESLTRYIGTTASNGTINFIADRTFNLDGTPVCNSQNACEAVNLQGPSFKFSLNFNGGVKTDDHGLCGQRAYVLTKDAQGNLMAIFSAFQCADGFTGDVLTHLVHD